LFSALICVRDHVAVGRDDSFVVRRDVFAFDRDLVSSWHRNRQVVQKTFGIDCRHATSPSRRNRLPVN
jgi:hypothetical protein